MKMERTKWMKGDSGIYQIVNKVNEKRYIGSAVNVEKRLFHTHFRELKNDKHGNPHLQNAFNLYGEKNFTFEPIFYCYKRDLILYEQQMINSYPFNTLYNICPTAGSTLGVKFSEEVRRVLSETAKRRKPRSEESKQKQSETRTGKKQPPEIVQKIAEANRGGKRSDEAKRKMSEAKRGRRYTGNMNSFYGKHHSSETKKKISATMKGRISWNKGIKRSEETKKKLSEAAKNKPSNRKGMKHSKETKRKMSESAKRRWGSM